MGRVLTKALLNKNLFGRNPNKHPAWGEKNLNRSPAWGETPTKIWRKRI
jgi:hypothetical protein